MTLCLPAEMATTSFAVAPAMTRSTATRVTIRFLAASAMIPCSALKALTPCSARAGSDELFGGRGRDSLSGGAGDDEIEGEEAADTLEGGGGNDQFNFNAGSFQPDSTFGARDVVLDFQRAGLAGGDVIRLSGDEFNFVGQIDINPRAGAPLPGAGDGVTQLGYAQRNGNTFLIADTDDNGQLNGDDFAVEFSGLQNFTVDDFDNTDFVTVGTNGDDVITGTPGDDKIFAAGGNDQVFALGGDDEVHGGTGNDFLDGGHGRLRPAVRRGGR